MLKAFWRMLSDLCWTIGAERWSLKFLLMSLETVDVTAPIITLYNTPPGTVPKGPFDLKVIFEDKQLIEELGDRRTNDVAIAKHILDVN